MRKPEEYKYYSTQRPISIGTFPKDHFKAPIRLQNYDGRLPVEGGAFRAWGELWYLHPLTEQQIADYELRPAHDNPEGREPVPERCSKKRSIAQQMKKAEKLAQEHQGRESPKTKAPDRGER